MLKLYNTITRKKQIFKPLKDKIVKIYSCGPTVYNYAHLGNLRTYIFQDILCRVLKYNNYRLRQIMNITDVEDKIIKKAVAEKKNIAQITKPYTRFFFNDLKKLNIEKAKFYPKATENIKEMIALIKKLTAKGFAYQSEDGSVYFNISKFKNYGKLSHLEKRKIKIGARISADEYKKDEARDFVLWKKAKTDEPSWSSPWGNGRPGWHIECSAMSMKYLGPTLDIHAGGVDLLFPHHENEIVQSEAATGKKFVRFWLHGEHLLVDEQKMSKSLGNILILRDIENKKINPLAFRYLVLTSHYRSKLNFTWESLEAAQNALNNLYNKFRNININIKTSNVQKIKYEKKFATAVNNDLNTSKALAIVWKIIADKHLSGYAKKQLLLKFDKILGFDLNKIKPLKIPLKIKELTQEREKLRINKQFIQADVLRKEIEELGYIIEDTAIGSKVLRK